MASLRSRTSSATAERDTKPSTGTLVAQVTSHHRSFGRTHVLRGVSLEIHRGEFVALLGRSGSGKSTLLRSLADLDPAPADQVRVHGRTSVAFQEPRLLPWRSVEDNVGLALLNAGSVRTRSERHERTADALGEVNLVEKADAWPLALSGGQAQRVSLARALVSEPDLLLLDEPFSALDALTRIEMHRLVTDLWQRHEPAVLLVTHDVDEALQLADRVLVLDGGHVAREWRVAVRRADRSAEHPELARTRQEVFAALGVTSTPQNGAGQNRPEIESGAA